MTRKDSNEPREDSILKPGARRRRKRSLGRENILVMMDRHLASPVTVTIRGAVKEVPAIEAIARQLMRKAIAGNLPAIRALAEYHQFANRHLGGSFELIFADDDYTRAMASHDTGKKDV